MLYIVVVLLPEVGCKVGLSLGGTNTKGINLQMLPQELGARRYLGPEEWVSRQGRLRKGLISACPLSGGMQPQVGMPGAGPVPLERGQGKTDACKIGRAHV